MHPYAVEPPDRKRRFFLLFSVASMLAAHPIGLSLYHNGLSLELTVLASAALALLSFYLILLLFDFWGWRWSLWQALGWLTAPDLNGHWEGHLTSSYDEHSQLHPIHITIRQRWLTMSIALEASDSISHSHMASFYMDDPNEVRISYEYEALPKPGAENIMLHHRGIAVLRLKEDGRLEGRYYHEEEDGKFIAGSMFLKYVPPD